MWMHYDTLNPKIAWAGLHATVTLRKEYALSQQVPYLVTVYSGLASFAMGISDSTSPSFSDKGSLHCSVKVSRPISTEDSACSGT